MINRMKTHTLVLLLIFQNMAYYFWIITWIKNVNNFQIATDHSPGIAEGYTSGVAYNRVAYKKTRNFCYLCSNKNFYIFAMSLGDCRV